jgi:pSer/pThr/pTyr-binding forkhead associated (FHA) protein
MSRCWTIGANADCDITVELPTVSGHHCRLIQSQQGYLIQDLGSTNGTYVNGTRVQTLVEVRRVDAVTLGATTPLPWPAESVPSQQVLLIGRDPSNDVIIDVSVVSSFHALVSRQVTSRDVLIEDLGSSNGTAVGAADRKASRSILNPGDTIFLGSQPLAASAIIARLEASYVPGSLIAGKEPADHAPAQGARPSAIRRPAYSWREAALLLQAPLLALVMVALLKPAEAQSSTAASHAVAAVVMSLVLAAIWFGLANAIFSVAGDVRLLERGSPPDAFATWLGRLSLLVAAGAVQTLVAWLIVAYGVGLKAPALPSLSLLVLASSVGLGLGVIVRVLAPSRAVLIATCPVLLVLLGLFGAGPQPLGKADWRRSVSSFSPSRWAFEGLLDLEAEARDSTDNARTAGEPAADLADAYFPSLSERVGPVAAMTALALMLLGVAAAIGLISWATLPAEPGNLAASSGS